jgi:hypothetical protein
MSLLLFSIAVIFYTISQACQHGKLGWGLFWSKDSWKNKYKLNHVGFVKAPNTWYYRTFEIRYKEKFPFSATLLVSLTDGYHLTQFFFKAFLSTSFVTYSTLFGLYDAGLYFVLFGIIFSITYKIIT